MDPRRRHRRLLLAAALSAAAAPLARAQAGGAPASLLNTASRLAMLAERIAKLQAQLGRDVLAARSRRALGEAAAEFEHGLQAVGRSPANSEERENHRLLRVLWDEFRAIALEAPRVEAGRKLVERTEELAWIATKGARLLHERGWTRAGELVMTAGRGRAAAQRLGKLHMQRGWSIAANAGGRETKAAEAEIQLSVAAIQGAPDIGEEAALSLRLADGQLALLRQAAERLAKGRDTALQLEHVAKSADNLAEAMDRLANACERVRG